MRELVSLQYGKLKTNLRRCYGVSFKIYLTCSFRYFSNVLEILKHSVTKVKHNNENIRNEATNCRIFCKKLGKAVNNKIVLSKTNCSPKVVRVVRNYIRKELGAKKSLMLNELGWKLW